MADLRVRHDVLWEYYAFGRSELAPTCSTPLVTRWSKLSPTINIFIFDVGTRGSVN